MDYGEQMILFQLNNQNLTLLTMTGSKLFSRLRITAEVLLKKNKTC